MVQKTKKPEWLEKAQSGSEAGPLAGIRVIDFSWSVVGPTAARWLACAGAEVIKVEHPKHPDLIRSMPLNRKGKSGPNYSGQFDFHNVSKLGLTLDTSKPGGREVFRKLIEQSDIVMETFSSRVMDEFGMSYDTLRSWKNDIIYVCCSGFGHYGRMRDYDTWGPTAQAVSGLHLLSGHPGMEPASWGYSFIDHYGGDLMCMAILFALYYREMTGQGQWVDLSQAEGAINITGPFILDHEVNGRSWRNRPDFPPGNRTLFPNRVAPHNTYRIAGKDLAGQDRWIGISCYSDEEWQALKRVMGNPKWAKDPKFATNLGRTQNEDELDRNIQAWTEKQDGYELMNRLQKAGVAAGVAQVSQERMDVDPQQKHLNMYPTFTHSAMGPCRVEEVPCLFSRTPVKVRASSPCVGEHNDYVLGEVLGFSDEEIAALIEEGVVPRPDEEKEWVGVVMDTMAGRKPEKKK